MSEQDQFTQAAADYLSGVDLTGLPPQQALRLGSLVAELLEASETAGYRRAIQTLQQEAERSGSPSDWWAYNRGAQRLEAITAEPVDTEGAPT